MYPKCYPGDLAIIVKAYNQVNIGLIVRVLHLHADQMSVDAPQGDAIWTCQAPQEMVYDIDGQKRKLLKGPVPDSYLYPLKERSASPDIAILAELELLWTSNAESHTCVCSDSHL
jgi:hypothetical protein